MFKQIVNNFQLLGKNFTKQICCGTKTHNATFKQLYISDKRNAFSFNGLEIDLDELEEFEKRVKAKREAKLKQQQQEHNTNELMTSTQNPNDISETKEEARKNNKTGAQEEEEVDELDEYLKNLKLKEQEQQANNFSAETRSAANFVLLLYWFLAILNLASATFSNRKHYSKCLLTVLN